MSTLTVEGETVMAEPTRYCPGCQQTLPLSAWFRSTPSGRCAECRKAYTKGRYRTGRTSLELRVAQLEEMVANLMRKVA